MGHEDVRGGGGWWLSELPTTLGRGAGSCLGFRLRAWSLPILHALTSDFGHIMLDSPRFTPAHSGTGWSSRRVPGLRAMSAGAPGTQDREAICPGPALASSCRLCDDETPRAMVRGPPANLSTTLDITRLGVQHDCAQWPTGGDTGSPPCLPGARCLPEVAVVTMLDP